MKLPFPGVKGCSIIKSLKKHLKKTLPTNLEASIIYTGRRLSSQLNDKDLTNSRRPYLGLLKMTFFSNNLLMLVLILSLLQKSYRTALIFRPENITNMASFREARLQLLNAFLENIINDEEFLCLEDINTSKTKEVPYYNYDYFELDKLSDDECLVEFRFLQNDVYQLAEALGLPEEMKCYNGVRVDGMEALCMYLKRFAYPC